MLSALHHKLNRHCAALALLTALGATQATARTHEAEAEVGASMEVSALPVLEADSHLQCSASGEMEEATHFGTEKMQALRLTSDSASAALPLDSAALPLDSAALPLDSAALRRATDSIARAAGAPQLPKARFVPDPKRALWLSLVLPGAGQIYNRKYWKLPIIYGGFLGCAYALTWNQMMYRDYSQAYLDIMDDDPNTDSYLDMLPPRYDITGREEQFKQIFKRKKDFYRRYRDLSAFCFVGVYLLSVIDAYVDAQLSVFDISPDLSMSLEPAVIGTPNSLGGTPRSGTAYGVGCSLRF